MHDLPLFMPVAKVALAAMALLVDPTAAAPNTNFWNESVKGTP